MKRLTAAFLAAVLVFALSGCSIFNKEYLSVSEYADSGDSGGGVALIDSYAALCSAIKDMVVSHRAQSRLRFSDYSGSLQSDLDKACQEVKGSYALANFAVSYMSYDISRATTYYEATVYITYKHTPKEIAAIQYVSGLPRLTEQLEAVMDGLGAGITVSISNGDLRADEVMKAVGGAFEEAPASSVVQPNASVSIYPESGQFRIVEIKLEYGWKESELKKMKNELADMLSEMRDSIDTDDAQIFALRAYSGIVSACKYDPSGQGRNKSDLNSGLGSTAYGALCEGFADSRGIALAFSALCREKNIECRVVTGTMDKLPHTWNMVKLGGGWYHVDVSASAALGVAGSFMRSDAEMQSRYAWDAAAYPVCAGTKTYGETFAKAG